MTPRPSSPTVCAEPQPAALALTRAYSAARSPPDTRTAPMMSIERSELSACDSEIRRGASAAARRVTGTLTNSTHDQPRVLVRTPPRTSPTTLPDPATAAQMPIAFPRSDPSSKSVVMIERAAGASAAAPAPCTARRTISSPIECDSPPASEASPNTIRPAMNSRRRPNMSASRPPSSSRPPKART